MTQGTLFEAQIKPRIEPVDPHLTDEEKPRLTRQCIGVLERLRCGPATNKELVQIATRFGARLLDLRRAGYDIQITARNRETGLTVYALVREP